MLDPGEALRKSTFKIIGNDDVGGCLVIGQAGREKERKETKKKKKKKEKTTVAAIHPLGDSSQS